MTENTKNKEKDELRDLFAGFNPPMADADDFISALDKRLTAIEAVKELTRAYNRRIKRAVGIAVFFGFLCGVVLTLTFPYIMSGISALLYKISPVATQASPMLSWAVVGLCTVASAITAYNLSLSPEIQSRIKD